MPAPFGAAAAAAEAAACDAPQAWRIGFRLAPTALEFGIDPAMLLDELRRLGSCRILPLTDAIPPLEAIEPTRSYLGFEVVLTTSERRSAIDDVFIFVADDCGLSIEAIGLDGADPAGPGKAAAPPVDGDRAQLGEAAFADATRGAPGRERPTPAGEGTSAPGGDPRQRATPPREPAEQATIRVPAMRLDALMDQVAELVIAQARLAQLARRWRDPSLDAVAEEIERLSTELRDSTMSMRMLPIGRLFGRYRRVVRDLSRELGKAIELSTEGEDTELDKTVIERLGDPLVHLIRNAIDHGIEDAARRAAMGKPKAGSIHLEARQAGAEVLIGIRDDGGGLDRARIRAKAIDRGLIDAGAALDERALDQLIFHPGFSTAQAVTSVSGRGVGMDVVKTTIEELRGAVEVASVPGRGTTVTLRLPLTLAIIEGLLVRVGAGMFVIPLAAVEECVELAATEHKGSSGRSFLSIRGGLVPFLRLHDLFARGAEASEEMVVIVGSDHGRVGLVVDQVVGHHQTVIKPLSRLHRGITGLAGATILGDGRVALIVDVMPLITFAQECAQRRLSA